MFASFSSTESGCNQCADVDTAYNSPINNLNNNNSQYSNNNSQQYNNVMNANQVGLNQDNTTQLNNSLNTLQPPTNAMMNNRQQSNGQVAMQQMVQKAVQPPNVVKGPTRKEKEVIVEAFEQHSPVQVNIPSRLILINLTFAVLAALSVNEAFKYYINRGLQMSDGSPHYYTFYAIGILLLAVSGHYITSKYS